MTESFGFVDKIVYINLAQRKDRDQHIRAQLKQVGIPDNKIVRFDAIKHDRGQIGCTLSHIAVLKMAIREGWSNMLVLEDDALWSSFESGYKIFLESWASHDVVVLGGTAPVYKDTKLISCLTTTGYFLKKPYYETLLENFEKGLEGLRKGLGNAYAVDTFWHSLMVKDSWTLIRPSLIIQKPGYSDICKGYMNYSGLF